MCTLRALFVLSEAGDVVFSRKWPTVERRARALYGSEYEPIPVDMEIKDPLLKEIRKSDVNSFAASVVSLLNGRLWPVLYLNKWSSLILAIPLIDGAIQLPSSISAVEASVGLESANPTPVEVIRGLRKRPAVDLPFITATLSVLETVADFVAPCAPRFEQTKMAELHFSINRFLAFGRPVDVDAYTIKALISTDFPKQDSLTEKRPAWRPLSFKGRNKIEITVIERINSVQYDRKGVKDSSVIFGRVQVKAEIEGQPDIVLSINKPSTIRLAESHYHQCVSNVIDGSQSVQISFTPGLGSVALSKYCVEPVSMLPIRGFYQLKEISSCSSKVLLQLKLIDVNAIQFEFFYVEMFFLGAISSLDLQPTYGTLTVDPKRRNVLIWNIGGKISGKSLEMTLPGVIHFEEQGPVSLKDIKVVENTDFAKLNFKITDYSVSGINVDSSSITLHPQSSIKKTISTSRIVESGEYYIWNSIGSFDYYNSADLIELVDLGSEPTEIKPALPIEDPAVFTNLSSNSVDDATQKLSQTEFE